MASVAVMVTRGVSGLRRASVPVKNRVVASPRFSVMSAPIQAMEESATVGAAENGPRVHGTLERPAGTRFKIAGKETGPQVREIALGRPSPNVMSTLGGPKASSPRPPESFTRKDAATDLADAPSAIDTDVVLAEIHVVSDPRNSGARKLRPGVFIDPRDHDRAIPFHQGGLATE